MNPKLFARDDATLNSLLENREWIRDLAGRLEMDPNQADDLAQETWLIALRHADQPPQSWKAYLATVMRRLVSENRTRSRRRAKREKTVAQSESLPSAAEEVEMRSLRESVALQVRQLSTTYQEVIVKRYVQGLTPSQIAKVDSVPISTVKTRLARGMEQLRHGLDRDYRGDRVSWSQALLLFPIGVREPTRIPPGKEPRKETEKKSSYQDQKAGASKTASSRTSVDLPVKILAGVVVLVLVSWIGFWGWRKGGDEGSLPRSASPPPMEVSRGDSPTGDRSAQREERVASIQSSRIVDEASLALGALDFGSSESLGRVVDLNHQPVSGVIVKAETSDGRVLIAPVDEEGRFALRGAGERGGLSRSEIVVGTQGWVTLMGGTFPRVASERRSQSRSEILVVASRSKAMAGTVCDAKGDPITGARLEVFFDFAHGGFHGALKASVPRRLFTTSGIAGTYQFDAVPNSGELPLFVTSPGHHIWKGTLPPTDGPFHIELRSFDEPNALSGRVVDKLGLALEDVWVGSDSYETLTDSMGRFFLPEDAGDDDAWTLAKEGLAPRRVKVPEDLSDSLEWTLGEEPWSARGRVVDGTGRPLSNRWVRILDPTIVCARMEEATNDEDITYYGLSWLRPFDVPQLGEAVAAGRSSLEPLRAVTNARGEFEFHGLGHRAYRFSAFDPSSLVHTTKRIDKDEFSTIELVLDEREWVDRFEGRLVFENGEAVGGAKVSVVGASQVMEKEGEVLFRSLLFRDPSVTDERGVFVIHQLPKSGVSFAIEGRGLQPFEVPYEGQTDLRLTVSRSVDLEVLVSLPDATHAIGLDEQGQKLIFRQRLGDRRISRTKIPLIRGVSPRLTMANRLSRIQLYADSKLLSEFLVPRLEPGQLHRISYP